MPVASISDSIAKTRIFEKTPKQHTAIGLLTSAAIHILLFGGSRSGKSLILLYAIAVRALKCKSRHVIFRKHFNAAKTSILLETWPKLKEMCFPGLHVHENKSDWYLKFPNGSEIWIAGLDQKERTEKILGKEYSTVAFAECSQMAYDEIQTALTRLAENSGLALKAYYDENPPNRKHWTHKIFIEKVSPITNAPLPNPEQYASILMNPIDNEENLPTNYIPDILGNLSEPKQKRFLQGEWQDETEGALWTVDMIAAHRVRQIDVPDLVRVGVGVDPAVTNTVNSDEIGIVAAGKGMDEHYYVIEDNSLKGSAHQWGTAVNGTYKRRKADRVIGETNNGGDLVEGNIRSVDRQHLLRYEGVHASRGKIVRADPVASLYDQGKVHHVGEFPDLEGEMTSYNPETCDWSPNRLDALVWVLTWLAGRLLPSLV